MPKHTAMTAPKRRRGTCCRPFCPGAVRRVRSGDGRRFAGKHRLGFAVVSVVALRAKTFQANGSMCSRLQIAIRPFRTAAVCPFAAEEQSVVSTNTTPRRLRSARFDLEIAILTVADSASLFDNVWEMAWPS